MKLEESYGRASYILDSDVTNAKITKTGAHITAVFKLGDKEVNPFFIAPWLS